MLLRRIYLRKRKGISKLAVDANTISGILDEIGKRLSGPAEHTYEILVKQAYLSGYTDLFTGLAFSALGVGMIYAIRNMMNNGFFKEHEDFSILCSIVGVFAAILLPIAIVCCLSSGVKEIINPEYYAIMDIMEKISGN